MARVYANLVDKGLKTLYDVPLALQNEVELLLNKEGK